jgi:two-component system, NarL family, nitrate/nitrite response regulator NarL
MLVVDGCEAMRKTLSGCLVELGDVSVQRASDFSSALALITAGTPVDLVLIATSGIDGLTALAALRKLFPELKVALVCGSTKAAEVRRAADLGAVGYLPKAMDRAPLIHAIRLILSGERFFPAQFLRAAAMSGPSPVRRGGLSRARVEPDTIGLTSRQQAVLRELAKGSSNREVGEALGISEVTVKIHVHAIFQKLGVRNRTQAVQRARDIALI